MNETHGNPSDNHFDSTASYLRRNDQPVVTKKQAPLSDPSELTDAREPRFHDPERWDGLS